MDKPSVTPAPTDRLFATEKAIQKAMADAAQALSGARHTLRITALIEDEAGLEASLLRLARTRVALEGASRSAGGAGRPDRQAIRFAARGPQMETEADAGRRMLSRFSGL